MRTHRVGRKAALCLPLALMPIACVAATGENVDANGEPVTVASFSYVGQNVINTLSASDASWQGRSWSFTGDNVMDPSWLLQTPLAAYWGQSVASLPIATVCDPAKPGCDADFKLFSCTTQSDCATGICAPVAASVRTAGAAPKSMCVGHSDAMVDQFYGVITSATRFVDVTSLTPPDGRFEAGLRNAITILAKKGLAIQVRLLFGEYPGANISTSNVLASVTRDVPAGSPIHVSVGAYRAYFDSWNHSKIVAADGKVAIVGGENMWDGHYLEKNPVHDVSIRVRGSAAQSGHLFANELWNFTCTGWTWDGSTSVTTYPGTTSTCPTAFVAQSIAPAGTTRVIGAGRLGDIGNQSSDDALRAMIAAAKSTVRIAQQDFGPVTKLGISLNPWPIAIMDEMVKAIARGVDVYVVLSNANSTAGGLGSVSAGYSNGWTTAQTAHHIANEAYANPSWFPAGTDIRALLCKKLHVAPLRPSADDTWPDGTPFALHAKTVVVDDLAFYVGSQNIYIANLAEYGFIVDDAAAAATYTGTFYTPMWNASKRVAVSGSEAQTCAL